MKTSVNIISTLITINILLLPLSANAAASMTCPDSFEPEGDWDHDGILNQEDLCCFTATLPLHNDPAYCSEEDGVDLNMNNHTAGQEGECCIAPTGECGTADSIICEESNEEFLYVSCDRLLFYTGMPSPTSNISCGTDCICYTVDDFDGDFQQTAGQQPQSGAIDNCPTTYNPSDTNLPQSNSDKDFFGDACDMCRTFDDLPVPCEMGMMNDTCPVGSDCVPFVLIQNQQTAVVEHYCATPVQTDGDGDGIGDHCDNCPKIDNPTQADRNQNGIGDECDPDIVSDTDTDSNMTGDSENEHETDAPDDSESMTETERTDTDQDTSFLDSALDTDIGIDTESDTVNETGIDTGKDTAFDTDFDAGFDTGKDAGLDTQTDSGKDTFEDSSQDTTSLETDKMDTESETVDPNGTDSASDSASENPEPDTEKVDIDSDGVPDKDDNCPSTANPDQNPSACMEDVYTGGAFSCDCSAAPADGGALNFGFFLALALTIAALLFIRH